MKKNDLVLTHPQLLAFQWLQVKLRTTDAVILRGSPRTGKTAVLRKVTASLSGGFISIRDLSPSGEIDELFLNRLAQSIDRFPVVAIDDFDLLPGTNFLRDAALTAILAETAGRKKLVFGAAGEVPWPIERRAVSGEIAEYVIPSAMAATG